MKYSFHELVDVVKLQELTDEFSIVASISSAIVNIDGEVLTGARWQRICTDFHMQHPQVQKECIKSDTKIRKRLNDGEPFVIYKCPRGMVDASSPVIIAGEHVANVFVGQVFLTSRSKTKEQFFRKQAQKFGFDEEEYIKAFREIPIFTEEKFRSVTFFLAKLAQMIAQIGYAQMCEMDSVKELEETSFDLKERVKELNCLYSISKAAETEHLTIDSLIQHVVDLIPSSLQYPDITCAIIHVNNAIAKTKFFKETKWKLSTPIYAGGQDIGSLKIFLTKKISSLENKLFLSEEKKLSEAICERTGKIIERLQGVKKLKEVETRYRLLTNQFADGITIIQNDEYKFVNTAFSTMTGYTSPKYLIGKKYHSYISKDFIKLYNESLFIETEEDDIQDIIEYKLLSKNGKEIWVEEKRNIIDWEFAPALLCTLRDITEKKEKEASSIEETKQLRNENILLRTSLKERYRFQNIIGISSVMQHVYDQILTAANSNASISIDGESGTGKELVAKAIHDLSNRKAGTFVTINCGAVPESLIESEFFGYKKGSFTGAVIDKHGFLDLADKGTLFLDEIGELSLNMQVKLLRAVDGGGYNPIGSNERHLSDFRIIAATNKNLKKEVIKGNIREDFYYRIQVIPINLPPLRKRKEDIPFLVEHFTQMFSKGSQLKKVPDNIISQIYRYDWPGNIRELQNVLLRYFSTGDFELIVPKKKKVSARADSNHEIIHGESHNLNMSVEKNEKELIIEALKTNNWHRIDTAAQLGISRSTLFRRLRKYGLLLKHTAQY